MRASHKLRLLIDRHAECRGNSKLVRTRCFQSLQWTTGCTIVPLLMSALADVQAGCVCLTEAI